MLNVNQLVILADGVDLITIFFIIIFFQCVVGEAGVGFMSKSDNRSCGTAEFIHTQGREEESVGI